MSEKKSKVAQEKERLPNGKFAPGVSGNPKGRPKKKKASEDLPEDFHDYVGKDAKKALESLLGSAKTRYEAHKLAKDLLPYQSPKLSNVESYSTEIKTIEIKWLTEPEDIQVIEGEVSEQITDGRKTDE